MTEAVQATIRPFALIDTGPLISACAFPEQGRRAFVHTLLEYVQLVVSTGVAQEALRDPPHRDAKIFRPLLTSKRINALSAPQEPEILDRAYDQYLGIGERDIIRLGIDMPNALVVIDDKAAFQVANRFGLKPVGFQDLLVLLSQNYGLPKEDAIHIATTTGSRYPASFLKHTLQKLGGEVL